MSTSVRRTRAISAANATPHKGVVLDSSLSIVLPAYNAQDRLAAQVHELLEVLPDLAARFEVLIVDDGSSDHTDEVAYELVRQFPQLKAIRHSEPLGEAAVIQTAIQNTSGEEELYVTVEAAAPISLKRLRATLKELLKES